jgi:hypothetical protein
MLTLYSFGPGANSLKPLLALYEKGLEFTPRFLNPAVFEHHEDWFKKINPRGQVPVLDHDGRIISESTVICEYLEDAFPDALAAASRRPLRHCPDAGLDQVGRRILLLVCLDDRLGAHDRTDGTSNQRRRVRAEDAAHPDPGAGDQVA